MEFHDQEKKNYPHKYWENIHRHWKKLVIILAALVAVATASLLILPAITMEQGEETLYCQQSLHAHTEDCYDANGDIICGYADFVVHTHDSTCYSDSGMLICPLEEIQVHAHDESCYREVPVLICGTEETEGHIHTDACYESQAETTLTCPLEEREGHTHGADCYQQEDWILVCGLEESENHTHTDDCYEHQAGGDLLCPLEETEGHTHDASCYQQGEPVLICGTEETEGHTHTDACYEYHKELVCGQEEILLHTHDASCFDADGHWICGKMQVLEHIHDQSCFPVEDTATDIPQDADSWATVDKPGYKARSGRLAAAPNSAQTGTDFGPYITQVVVSKEVDGQWVPATEFTNGDSAKVNISYSIPEGIVGPDSRVIYYQLPSGIGLDEDATGPATIGDEVVGTYIIHQNGLIEITFDTQFADGKPFTGKLEFQGTVTLTGGQGEDEIFFGGDGGSITVVPKEEETDLTITKTGYYDKELKKLGYAIEVSTQNGSDGPITITDAFLHHPDDGIVNYDTDSIHIMKKDAAGAQTEITGFVPVFQQQTAGAAASFILTELPALQAGEAYILYYTATPDLDNSRGEGNGYLGFSNKATAQDSTNDAEAQISTKVSLSMIAKEGTYDALTRKVKWTILINEDGRDIGGYQLEDTLTYTDSQGQTHQLELPESVTLTRLEGWNPAEESVISIPYTFPAGTNSRYMVTYETDLPAGVQPGENITFHNWAGFGEYETEVDVGVTIPEPLDYNVQKGFWGSAGDNGELSWGSLITYPAEGGDLSNLMYVDRIVEVMQEDGTFLADSHYTTLRLLYDSLYVSTTDGTPLVYGTDFEVYAVAKSSTPSIEQIASADFWQFINNLPWQTITSFGEDEPLTLFGIAFSESALEKITGQSIIIGYHTQVALDKIPNGVALRAGNYARIPDHEAYAYGQDVVEEQLNKQVSATGVVEGSKDTHSFTDDPLTIDYSQTDGLLHYRLLLHRVKSVPDAVTVTDTLPKGTQLVDGSVKLRLHSGENRDDDYWDVEGQDYYLSVATQEQDDGTTTVTFTITHHHEMPDDGILAIYYDVSVAGDPAWEEGDTQVYENHAQWGDTTDSTTTTVKRVTPNLVKTGEQLVQYDEEGNPSYSDTVRYYITVNTQGDDLNPYADTLTLEDTMSTPAGSGAAFLPESVKLYHYQADGEENHYCGELIDGTQYTVSYNSETHTITFTLPDATPCVLVYDYSIDRGTAAGDIQISNKVTLSGRSESSSEAGIIMQEQSSSATVNKATVTIYKHDSKNVTALLPGAAFKLERYEYKDGSYQWNQTSVTAVGGSGEFITGDSGMIVLNFLEEESLYNTLYRLTELSAPEGYLPSDEPQYFVWMEQGANEEQTVEKMRGNGALDGISPDDIVFIPFSTSGTLYVPNELDQLTVTKKWQNENGEPMENPPSDSVKVTLYQWDADDRQSVYAQVELKEENGWSYTWKNLPRADDNGGEYRYTVEEEPVAGFDATYSENNADGIQTGVIEIINTKGEGYVLPETGGIGTYFYTVGGLLLVGICCAGCVYLRRRYRKGDASST